MPPQFVALEPLIFLGFRLPKQGENLVVFAVPILRSVVGGVPFTFSFLGAFPTIALTVRCWYERLPARCALFRRGCTLALKLFLYGVLHSFICHGKDSIEEIRACPSFGSIGKAWAVLGQANAVLIIRALFSGLPNTFFLDVIISHNIKPPSFV